MEAAHAGAQQAAAHRPGGRPAAAKTRSPILCGARGGADHTDQEVTKAYRRQMSRHHPDKLVANGLPESMAADREGEDAAHPGSLPGHPRRTRHALRDVYRMNSIIAPSILSADFARLGEEVKRCWPPAPTGCTST